MQNFLECTSRIGNGQEDRKVENIEIDKKHRIITVYDGSNYDSGVEDYLMEQYPNYQIVVEYGKRSTATTKAKKAQTVKQKK